MSQNIQANRGPKLLMAVLAAVALSAGLGACTQSDETPGFTEDGVDGFSASDTNNPADEGASPEGYEYNDRGNQELDLGQHTFLVSKQGGEPIAEYSVESITPTKACHGGTVPTGTQVDVEMTIKTFNAPNGEFQHLLLTDDWSGIDPTGLVHSGQSWGCEGTNGKFLSGDKLPNSSYIGHQIIVFEDVLPPGSHLAFNPVVGDGSGAEWLLR